MSTIVALGPDHCEALLRFFRELPEGDLTFIKEDVTDPGTVQAWTSGDDRASRWVAEDAGSVLGYVSVLRLSGWSDHVGEVRLVVSPAARETVQMLVRDNGMVTDRLTVGGDRVHLSDIRLPFLTVRADRDHIVPPAATAPLIDLVGSEDKHELRLDAGHMGLVVGRTAARTTVPTILDFLRRRSEPASDSVGAAS